MFTRKHYKAIAEIMANANRSRPYITSGQLFAQIEEDLACFFERDNLNFDRDKFLAACSD